MGNIQTGDKQKTGKSPGKSKNFIRNLNRKSDSKKHGKNKNESKKDANDREFDKTPECDNADPLDASDNDTIESVYNKTPREGLYEESSKQSPRTEVTVPEAKPTCPRVAHQPPRSPTRDSREPPASTACTTLDVLAEAKRTPTDDSNSDSVFTEPLTPLGFAAELNQCYYSAESDSAHDEPLAPPATGVRASRVEDARKIIAFDVSVINDMMPHDSLDAITAPPTDKEKQTLSDAVDVHHDNCDKSEDEKVMGSSMSRGEELERGTHECHHELKENRLKPCPGQTSFTISKHRKVELSPAVREASLLETSNILDSEHKRFASVSDSSVDSNVLRKVASLTLDKASDTKVFRPKFVPEKLNFQLYEKFEGQMLVNWFISSITENKHLKNLLQIQDLKNIGIQYCTHLLAAGVLRQISDKDAPSESEFKPNLMYYWTHMETPTSQPVTPGRIQMSKWPPDKDDFYKVQDSYINSLDLDKRSSSHSLNEDVSDLNNAKLIITELRRKLQDLEYQIEKHKINKIDSANINSEIDKNSLPVRDIYMHNKKTILLSKETQTSNSSNDIELLDKNSNKAVINLPESDSHVRKHFNLKMLDLSCDIIANNENQIDINEQQHSSQCEVRSDLENYCKLNKTKDVMLDKQNNQTLETKFDNTLHESSEMHSNKELEDKHNSNLNESQSNSKSLLAKESKETNPPKDCAFSNNSTIAMLEVCPLMSPISKTCLSLSSTETASLYSSISTPNTIPLLAQALMKNESSSSSVSSNEEQKYTDAKSELSNQSVIEIKYSASTKIIEANNKLIDPNSQYRTMDSEFERLKAIMPPPPPILPPMPKILPPPPPLSKMDPSVPMPIEAFFPPPTPPNPAMDPPMPPPIPKMDFPPAPPPLPKMDSPPAPPPLPKMDSPPAPPPLPKMDFPPAPPPLPKMDFPPAPPPLPKMDPLVPIPIEAMLSPPPPPIPAIFPPPPPMLGMGPPPPPMPGMGPLLSTPDITAFPSSGANLPPPPPMPGIFPQTTNIPPPPIGPVPFPTPPVGGWNMQKAALRKNPVIPAAPMKPLYWTRILATTPNVETESKPIKPLWLEIEETKLDNIDEFTDLFSRQVVKAPVKKKVEVKNKVLPVKILDSKRSQNVGILAQSLNVVFTEIENAVYYFDTSVISLEALQQIYELRATEEELSQIKEHLSTKPDIPLDRPESFLNDLSTISNFSERISCFMFQADFEDAASTTMHKLDNLKHTCEFLVTNESLKKLFAIILTLGNYMNGGNGQRGQADGFGLEILSKLRDVKSKQSNITLLHFIVRTYISSCGGALATSLPVPEPGDIARAAAIDFNAVASDLRTLTQQLNECKKKTQKVINSEAFDPSNDMTVNDGDQRRLEVFKEKMTTFLTAAEDKLKAENDNLEECRCKFIATVKFYQYRSKNGKPEDCEPDEFFSLWTSFCSDFKDIFKKEEQLAIKERLKEAKKQTQERKSMTQPKKEGGLKARLQKLSSKKK